MNYQEVTHDQVEAAARAVGPRYTDGSAQRRLLAAMDALMGDRRWYLTAGLLFVEASAGTSWYRTGANRCTCSSRKPCYHMALRDLCLEMREQARADRPAGRGLPPGVTVSMVLAAALELQREEGLTDDEAYDAAVEAAWWEHEEASAPPPAPEPLTVIKTAWGLILQQAGRKLVVRDSDLAQLRQILGAAA